MKFLKKAVFSMLCLSILFISVPSSAKIDNSIRYSDDFQTALNIFKNNGLIINEIKLQVWGQISNSMEPYEVLDSKYRYITQYLKLDQKKIAVQKELDGFMSVSHIEERRDALWQISIQSIPIDENRGESYLGLLYVTDDVKAAGQNHCLLLDMFDKMGFKEVVGITMTSDLPGYITIENRQRMANNIARTVNGEFVEGIVDDNLTSMSYYSNRILRYLKIAEKKININIAMHYDESSDVTHLYIGIPLIYQDY